MGDGPWSVVVGDANNDGQQDIVTANSNGDNVSILTWNVTSGNWNAQTTRAVGDYPSSVAVGDANNDGQQDIVTANDNLNTVSILLWNVTTGNWSAQTTRVVDTYPESVAVGDANNDGQNDIVTANYLVNTLSILTWNVTTKNWNAQTTRAVGIGPYKVAVGDANNDGQNDIVTATYGDDTVSIFTWTRITRPSLAIILPNPSIGVVSLSWTDVAPKYIVYRENFTIIDITSLTPHAIVYTNAFNEIVSLTGTYYYAIIATDGFSVSALSNCESVYVDKNPPNCTNFQFPMTETRSTGNITLEVADNIGVSHVLLYIDHADFGSQNQTMNFNGTRWWFPYTPTTAEERTVIFYMNDTLGNWNSTSFSISDIFYSPPTYARLSYPGTMAHGVPNEILLTNVVDNTQVQAVNISINDLYNATMVPLGGNAYKYLCIPVEYGANQFFTLYLFDNLGNLNATKVIYTVIEDVQAPSWSNLTAPPVDLGSAITICINASDNTVLKQVLLFVTGADFPFPNGVPMTLAGDDEYRYTFTPSIDGTRAFSIVLEDIAGNKVYISGSFEISAPPPLPSDPLIDLLLNILLNPFFAAGIVLGVALVVMFLYFHYRIMPKIAELEKAIQVQAKGEKGTLENDVKTGMGVETKGKMNGKKLLPTEKKKNE